MSNIKELKNNSENNINVIETLQQFIMSDKTKYIELFRKVIKNKLNCSEYNIEAYMKNEILSGLDYQNFNDVKEFEFLLIANLISFIGKDDINLFNKFIDYNERNLIDKKDVTTYKTFDELSHEVGKADIKSICKELEKQIYKVYEDKQWLLLKPLTYESSKKYGSNTKWCTASSHNPDHFFDYMSQGTLIYCINKINGIKYGVYKGHRNTEVSFWNEKDSRIDSFFTDIPSEILSILRDEIRKDKTNLSHITVEEFEKDKQRYLMRKKSDISEMAGSPVRLTHEISNRFDEAPNQEIGEDEQPSINIPIMPKRTEEVYEVMKGVNYELSEEDSDWGPNATGGYMTSH